MPVPAIIAGGLAAVRLIGPIFARAAMGSAAANTIISTVDPTELANAEAPKVCHGTPFDPTGL